MFADPLSHPKRCKYCSGFLQTRFCKRLDLFGGFEGQSSCSGIFWEESCGRKTAIWKVETSWFLNPKLDELWKQNLITIQKWTIRKFAVRFFETEKLSFTCRWCLIWVTVFLQLQNHDMESVKIPLPSRAVRVEARHPSNNSCDCGEPDVYSRPFSSKIQDLCNLWAVCKVKTKFIVIVVWF